MRIVTVTSVLPCMHNEDVKVSLCLGFFPPLLFYFFFPTALLCLGTLLFSARNTPFLLSILYKEALLSLVHSFNGGILTHAMMCTL